MEEDTEYIKLPVEDRCVHKVWKARVHGYEEAKKLFSQIADEKSPEWNKFLGLMKKMVVDSNALAQEKGLEAVLVFVENAAVAGKTVGEVMSGLVTKCIAAPKAKTKELAAQIILMYVEIEKHETVTEELLKGTEQKNPKIVSGCINLLTQAIREFGIKVINIKPTVKRLPALLEDRDKTVRDETKVLTVEIYRWIGVALNPQLASLKPVQVTELETEFEKVKGEKAVPTRYLRSQQAKQAKIAAEAGEAEEGVDEDVCDEGGPEIDPYELMVSVDIISKLPKDWHEKVEAKKWQERKEALDTLEGMLQGNPKLESGDYGDIVRALKKMVTKDANVVVVALAAKCLASVANGLKKRFQPYATACIAGLLEKFREKKQAVVIALRDAVDAMFAGTTLEAIQEDVLAALENKNPSVKAETAAYLARCFTKSTPITLNKKTLKAYCAVLLKTLNEPDPTVRDASAEALGTAMKVVGEKGISPFLADVDNLKMTKIKEACDKAELQVKQPKAAVVKKPAPAVVAPTKSAAGSAASKPVKRPSSAGPAKKSATSTKKAAATSSSASAKSKPVTEREMSPEEVDEKSEALFPPELLSGLADSNWKSRMSAVEQFQQMLGTLEPSEAPSQLLLRVINKKPGLKDTNFQVAKLRLDAVKSIAETYPVTLTGVSCVVTDIADKLSDTKTQAAAADALTALSEATKLEHVAIQALEYAFTQKNPKVQVEVFNWLSSAIQEFGLVLQPKQIMDHVKKGVTAINPAVRNAGVAFLGVLSVYTGPSLTTHFDSEKPALQQLIATELEKHAGESPRSPVRGAKQQPPSQPQTSRRGSADTVLSTATEEEEEPREESGDPVPSAQAAMPPRRVDLTPHITDALINELTDKNWKVRAEAVQKIQNLVNEHRSITSGLGECAPVLAARIVDSNTKIAAATLALCQSMAVAMGPDCKHHLRTFTPNCIAGMGDSKSWIRSAAIACMNTWGDQCGYQWFFDGEMIADALKTGSPTLRIELWGWMAEKLPNIKTVPKDELVACIPTLLANLEDRNADVRKNAAEAVLGVMMHTGYGPLYSACDKLKPGSQGPVKIILEKTRGSLPEKPVQKSKSASNIPGGDKGKANAKMGPGSTATFTKPKSKPSLAVAGKPGGRSKKDEEADTSPLLQTNSLKHQRFIDEQKLKTLKWNFTTPREEFVELLKDQMTTAGVNKALMANMFHADFKYHLRAIDSLNEDLAMNADAQRANLDLILRWLTLRFFDTNPSVLLKGLEYLQTLFAILLDNQYNLMENEASSFLPYLILKIGDPKDAVRNNVRALLKQIWSIYPISKLFVYLMDGIKSKNARQRTECLEHMCVLMENFGMSVCQPTPATALKEIAKQISDRDNSVRTAALNCIVAGYFLDGEKVLKMVGQISDKDMSLLEERIKRAAKNRPVASVKPLPQVPAPRPAMPAPNPSHTHAHTQEEPEPEEEEEEEEVLPPLPMPSTQSLHASDVSDASLNHTGATYEIPPSPMNGGEIVMVDGQEYGVVVNEERKEGEVEHVENDMRVVTGPFGLDQALLESIESRPITCSQPKLIEFDLSFLREPSAQVSAAPKLGTSISLSPLSKMSNTMSLEWYLTQIANRDVDKAREGVQHIEDLLLSDQRNHLHQHEDLLVAQLVRQLEFLNQSNHPEVVNCYKRNLSLFVKFFGNYPELSRNVKENTLREAVRTLIMLLTEKRLEMLDPGTDMFTRVVNNVVIRILDKSDHTAIICALVKNLYDTVNNPALSSHYQELLMKCIWKVIKFLDDWVDELQYDLIFVDIHAFLRDYPSSWWKKQPSDTPLRTVKTIMHTIVKLNGPVIGEIVRNVRGVTPESELFTYVQKLLKHIRVVEPGAKTAPLQQQPSDNSNQESPGKHKRLSKNTHDQLSEIFRKIGSRDETNEGLRLLYDFKLQYPEADINPFLQKSSKFFQDYIDRGLKSIEADRRMAGITDVTPINKEVEIEDNDSGQYMQRLRAWQVKAGWDNLPAAATRPTPAGHPHTLPLSPPQHPPEPDLAEHIRHPHLDMSSENVHTDECDVEALRKRLEKVRNAIR